MNVQLGFRYPKNVRRYVLSCTHSLNKDSRLTTAQRLRARYLGQAERRSLVVPVVLNRDVPCGFAELIQGEHAPRPFHAPQSLVMHCINSTKRGAGRILLNWAMHYARARGLGSVVVEAYDHPDDFWFMPASFFRHNGFEPVVSRGTGWLLWKPIQAWAVPPSYIPVRYRFCPDATRVTVEVFYCPLCSHKEVLIAKAVCAECGDEVILRCVSAGIRRRVERCGLAREIVVDGQARGGGDIITADELRALIDSAIARRSRSGPPNLPQIDIDRANRLF